MAYTEVNDLNTDIVVAIGGKNKKTGKNNPTSVEGYFLGSREINSPKSKTGKAAIHVFQTAEGSIGVWGKTDLDRKMKGVQPGFMTKVSFDGMSPTKNGDMYKFKVLFDPENAIEVAGALDTGSNENKEDDEEETDEDESYVAEALVAEPPRASASVKVQDLLKNRRSASKAG